LLQLIQIPQNSEIPMRADPGRRLTRAALHVQLDGRS
jgi:hypothetical protein